MSEMKNFRKSVRGFNRMDVVNYIEYLNEQHNSEIAQLTSQLQTAQEALEKAESAPRDQELLAQLEAAQARCAELEAQLATAPAAPAEKTDDELEAYRRAERVERMAQDRAAQIYAQANAVLADATVKAAEAAEGMQAVAQQATQQLQQAEQQLQDAVAALYAIRPEE